MKKFPRQLLSLLGIFCIYLLISVVLFFPRWSKLTTHYGSPDFDTDGTLWYQWARIFTEERGINFTFTNDLFAAPFGYDVAYIPYFSLIYEVNIFFMKLLGGDWSAIITIANLSTLLTFPLSALAAFALTFYITKKTYPSFIAGLIYSFSFYHVVMVGGSLSLNHIECIPLFFLSLLFFIDRPSWKSVLISALAFVLLFMSNAYWAFFSMVFTPIFFCFYGNHDLPKRMRLFLTYYPVVLGFTILTNIDYVWNQLYNLSPYYLQYVFPKAASAEAELISTISFFAPSMTAAFRPWYFSAGGHFLGYAGLLISFAAFFSQKKHRNYGIFLACLLLAILLASRISPFFALNELYFHFFRAFRAVSRLVILASLFLGVLTAISLDSVVPKMKTVLPKRLQRGLLILCAVLLPVIILIEGLTLTSLSRRTTDFRKIAALYEPLRSNPNVQMIVSYPFVIPPEGDSFPQNYESVGQIVHGKTLVSGLSRSIPQARANVEKLRDLTNPQTIDELEKSNIDTIVIYHNFYPDIEKATTLLNTDERVQYLGTFEQPKDENTYLSTNDLSRKISVYQLKKVVENNQLVGTKQELEALTDTGEVSIHKVSPLLYTLTAKNVQKPFQVILHEPYSKKWQLYPGKITSYFEMFLKSPILTEYHDVYQNSENSWQIDPEHMSNLPNEAYTLAEDGSVDLHLTLFFAPALLQAVSDVIRIVALFSVLLLLFVSIVRDRYTNAKK